MSVCVCVWAKRRGPAFGLGVERSCNCKSAACGVGESESLIERGGFHSRSIDSPPFGRRLALVVDEADLLGRGDGPVDEGCHCWSSLMAGRRDRLEVAVFFFGEGRAPRQLTGGPVFFPSRSNGRRADASERSGGESGGGEEGEFRGRESSSFLEANLRRNESVLSRK